MKATFSWAAVLIGTAHFTFAQGTTQTVLPYGLESRNGNSNDALFMGSGERQEWFRSSYLSQVWTTPVVISEVAFRVQENIFGSPYSGTMPHIEIWMTTTQTDWQDLQIPWSMNQSEDALRVYAADDVVLNSPGGSGPNPFNLRFTFSQPFIYNPQNGNLLMRIMTDSNGAAVVGSRFLDAENFGPEDFPIASVGYSEFGGDPFPRGPVVQFTWSPIPEPSIAKLLSFSLLLLFKKRGKCDL